MNLKQFLRPDWRKIVVFIILSLMFVLIKRFPLEWEFIGEWKGGSILPEKPIHNLPMVAVETIYKPINLILDLIFWYLFSCFVIWICDKVKKKEVKQINS
jgi:hypothetical protein